MPIGDDDLDLIFDSGDFNVTATFGTTPNVTREAIFNEPTDSNMAFGVEIEAVRPTLTLPTANVLATFVKGLTVTLLGRSFKIEEVKKAGAGLTDITLKTA